VRLQFSTVICPPSPPLLHNSCADGYASLPPMFRCSSCATGFYPGSSGECIKCPSSPAALFIGFAIIIAAVAGIGYFLSRKGVNLAFISIGVDFFQVC
jgi:hypothetical protein